MQYVIYNYEKSFSLLYIIYKNISYILQHHVEIFSNLKNQYKDKNENDVHMKKILSFYIKDFYTKKYFSNNK